ncbi:MAG: PEGA domain-containing protein [Deltaproteobacteria bacterium]|nr:PEGA domain-containing protein [Deltaproteobacteria bacterium]
MSTNPSGAQVHVDGREKQTTPCTLDLVCTQDHILTLTKKGYQQRDVIIKRKYQQEEVLLNAINSGVTTGSLFNNVAQGINSGVQSINDQEMTGQAYILIPSAVSVCLSPVQGFQQTTTEAEAAQAKSNPMSPLSQMDAHDEQLLENALETSKTGETTSWTNNASNITFAVIPEDAIKRGNRLIRNFSLASKYQGQQSYKTYRADRIGRGEWQVEDTVQPGQTIEDPAERFSPQQINSKKVLRALGEVHWPKYEKSTTLGKTSSSTTHYNSDGSITTKKSSSSVSGSIGVSPGAAFKLLDALN